MIQARWRQLRGDFVWTAGLNRLAVAHGLASIGDALVTVSLAGSLFFNLSPAASRQQVLLYLVVNMAPFVMLAPLIGPAIDRFPGGRRMILATLFVIRAALAAALAFVLFELAFYFVALAFLLAGKASGVTRQAVVPSVTPKRQQLVAANARLARVAMVAAGIAGAIGVPLMATTSATVTLVVAAGCFLVAAITAAGLPAAGPMPTTTLTVEYEELHTPIIIATAWAFAVVRAVVGFFVFGLAFALRRESEAAWMYGAAVFSYGAGTFAALVVAPLLRRRYEEERLVAGSLVGLAIVAAFAALGPSRSLVLTMAAVLGIAAMIGRQGFDALVQHRAPRAWRGRAFARFEARFQLAWVLGAIAATAIAVSTQVSVAVVAVALVPTVGIYLRRIGEARAADTDDPFDVAHVASQRIFHAMEWNRRGHRRLAVAELAGLAQLARAGGWRVTEGLLDRLETMQSALADGREPDESSFASMLDDARRLVAELHTRQGDVSAETTVDPVTVHRDARRSSTNTERTESRADR